MPLKKLEKENLELRKKLSVAKNWMEKEVNFQLQKIAKDRLNQEINNDKKDFFNNNVEEIITTSVSSFFGEMMLLNTPETVVENIISAEISFYNMRENQYTDGLGVITSYHKSIDYLIESTITKPFRKYAKKQGQIYLRVNDPIEKSINLVVNKGYILGFGRLYHIIQKIKNDEHLDDYGKCFRDFLNKYSYINDILLDDDFYKIFKQIVSTELLGKKRHSGKINFEETKKARTLLIGDLKDQNSIIYRLIEMGKPDF